VQIHFLEGLKLRVEHNVAPQILALNFDGGNGGNRLRFVTGGRVLAGQFENRDGDYDHRDRDRDE